MLRHKVVAQRPGENAAMSVSAVTSVTSGQTVSGVVVPNGQPGGIQYVLSGGTAVATTVASGEGPGVGTDDPGEQIVSSGGVASGTYLEPSDGVDPGARQTIAAGGTAVATTVDGSQVVGGTAIGDVVGGDVMNGVVVGARGDVAVGVGGTLDGAQIGGGSVSVGSGGSAIGTLVIGTDATLDVTSGGSVTGVVEFNAGPVSVLSIADPSTFTAVVSGLGTVAGSPFGAGDVIDLTSLPDTDNALASASLVGDLLSVTDGGVTQAITVDPAGLLGAGISFAKDSQGGTELLFGGTATIACFAAGTRIATARGSVPVEALRVGDFVRLIDGDSAPVVWLGHRRVKPGKHPRPADVQPVRVCADAFGLGRPARDVLLSPDHSVFADDVLIPVRYLLNGATVRQEDFLSVTYWHVELPAHAVLLAEGLPCESFLDTGNRTAFANGGAAVQAHPTFARAIWDRAGCAPLVVAGPVREAVYRRLLAQAAVLGWRTADAGGGAVTWIAPAACASG
jgi:hypothetical protein